MMPVWFVVDDGWSNAISTTQTTTSTSSSIWSAYNNNQITTSGTVTGLGNITWAQQSGLTGLASAARSVIRVYSPTWETGPQMGMGIPREVERFADVAVGDVLQAQRANLAAPSVLRRREPTPAERRANELLVSMLTDEQRQSYEQRGWFIVVGGSTGRRYRIRCNSYQGNVDLLAANDNNRIEYRFCGHCRDQIPLGDHLLAQKIMLEIDETAFIGLANRSAA